jgi:hypothetical protein
MAMVHGSTHETGTSWQPCSDNLLAAPPPQFPCDICNIQGNSEVNLKQHMASRKHLARLSRHVLAKQEAAALRDDAGRYGLHATPVQHPCNTHATPMQHPCNTAAAATGPGRAALARARR